MTEIIIRDSFPVLAKEKVESILNEFSWLCPVWLQKLYINYEGGEPDDDCYINVEKDYRFANLIITGNWISQNPDQQCSQILHELIHLYNLPVKNTALETYKTLLSEAEREKFLPILKSELTAKNEQATCDLTFAIINKLKNV